jgi:ABC-type sugar transport system ATPase subunit
MTPDHSGPPLLEIRGLTKDFQGTRALDSVDLDVAHGEIHALLGENGAGKSTLIKSVAGIYEPTAGTIAVDGKPLHGSTAAAVAAGIAVVHQHSNLVNFLSVEENLWLGKQLPRRAGCFVDWSAVRRRARDILQYVGLTLDPRMLVSELSADQRAMISIGKAIASDARLIILDEPTAALLPAEVETLFAQMRRLAREGHGFLYVSHRLSEVMEVADRATVLRDGRNAGSFDRSTFERRAVINAIIGPSKSLRGEAAPAATTGTEMLSVAGVRARRIEDVSFTVRRGEVLGLAGLPGSGAEEMIEVLFGRSACSSGTMSLDGRKLALRDVRDAIAAGIALVPKDRLAEGLISGHCVRENITIVTLGTFLRERIFGFVDHAREARSAASLAERLNIKSHGLEAAIESLSGGNQQKAVLARWLDSGAKLFLLDSPTAAVDVGAKGEIYDLIRSLAKAGAAVVFVSTEVEEYPRVAERVLVFAGGRISGELSGAELTESEIMHLAMGSAHG